MNAYYAPARPLPALPVLSGTLLPDTAPEAPSPTRTGRRVAAVAAATLLICGGAAGAAWMLNQAPAGEHEVRAAVVLDSVATATLGTSAAPEQRGYGDVRPGTIFNGGDPTGLVRQLRWASWGTARAEATGLGSYVPAGSDVAHAVPQPVRVIASDLGDCGGHPAYRSVAWYFPGRGQTAATAYHQDTCTR